MKKKCIVNVKCGKMIVGEICKEMNEMYLRENFVVNWL